MSGKTPPSLSSHFVVSQLLNGTGWAPLLGSVSIGSGKPRALGILGGPWGNMKGILGLRPQYSIIGALESAQAPLALGHQKLNCGAHPVETKEKI